MSVYKAGTALATNGSVAVVGTGTAWVTAGVSGGLFSKGGVSEAIESVEDDTHLTLAQPWAGITSTSIYSILRDTANAADIVDLYDRLTVALRTLSLAGIHPNDLGTIAYRNTLTAGLGPTDKFIFLRAELSEDFEYYVWDGPVDEAWIGPYPVAIPPDAPTSGIVSSNASITDIIELSETAYDALTPGGSTVYFVTPDP